MHYDTFSEQCGTYKSQLIYSYLYCAAYKLTEGAQHSSDDAFGYSAVNKKRLKLAVEQCCRSA